MIAKKYFKYCILTSLFFVAVIFLPVFSVFLHAQTSLQSGTGVDVNLNVQGCNNNGICEAGLGENRINCALDCNIISPDPPTVTLTADPDTINSGSSSVLSWSSTNTASCSASWTVSIAISGSISVSPTETTSYDITCTGPTGTVSDSVIVTVVAADAPTVNLVANPDTINSGDSSTLSWNSTNVTSCSAPSWTNATTTSGSKSVSPSTTSTYTIMCTGPNGSANDSATVTVGPPPVTPPGGNNRPSSGGFSSFGANLVITSLSISTDQRSAIINWSGNNTALSIFSWGATSDYEMGSISDVFFITNHRIIIKNLTVGTHYYFKISARDLYGHVMNYFGDFNTLSFTQLSTLPNVRDLIVTYPSDLVTLTWRNPESPNFSGVMVVRSPYTYPRDSSDGKIIYEGKGNYVTDLSAQKNTTYYYTVFVYDSNRNFSSGSIVKSFLASSKPATVLPPTFTLQLSDFDFIQNGRSSTYKYYPVGVVTDQNLTVSISATKLPASLRFGTIQVDDPTDSNSSTYLFSFNKSRDAYEAEVNLFGVPGGMYPFTISFQFDMKGGAVLTSTFDVTKSQIDSNNPTVSELQTTYGFFWIIFWIILILIVIFLIGLVLYLIIRKFTSHKN